VRDMLRPSLEGRIHKDLAACSRDLVVSFLRAVETREPKGFYQVLEEILEAADPSEDHSDLWQSVISVLRLRTAAILPADNSVFAENLFHQARLTITDHAERCCLRKRLSVSEINHQIGWMTTRMFSAASGKDILRIFTEHLAEIGVRFAQVALFEPRKNNPFGGITFYCNLWSAGSRRLSEDLRALCVDTADFPTPDILPAEKPFALALLPIVFRDEPMGFAVFDAGMLEPLATIIRQLPAALKTQELFVQTEELSLLDPSTGVQNRRFFQLFLQRELERCRRYQRGVTLLMLSLGGWAKYVSAQGANNSREAMCNLAQRITACVRRGSDIVCRYAGETFAVLLPETGRSGVEAVADSIRKNIEADEAFRGLFDIGIGIAVAETDSACSDPYDLVAAANRALFQAKSAGRNRTEIVQLAPPADSQPAPTSATSG
jgi:diguanylate cyclase (GGDEF)-like protein